MIIIISGSNKHTQYAVSMCIEQEAVLLIFLYFDIFYISSSVLQKMTKIITN